jgi:hypothetical protein
LSLASTLICLFVDSLVVVAWRLGILWAI